MQRTVVALGGNALQRSGGAGTWAEAEAQMRATVPAIAALARDGHELVLTHGNGPQVGALLRQVELAEREVPRLPVHVLDAETEGQIGYLVQQELTRALHRVGTERTVVPMISRVEVSARDPAFKHPTKPVGRFYSESEVRLIRKREGWQMVYDGARGGWRRVVPSPRPLRWLEGDVVRGMLENGGGRRLVPVVGGGGGIPVVQRRPGQYEGVEAVVDKDLTAALVANTLAANTLAIVTDVPGVALGFGKPWERWLGETHVEELEEGLRAGEFGGGSMAPKVEAGVAFLKNGGRRLLITDAPSLGRAFRGEVGTRVTRS